MVHNPGGDCYQAGGPIPLPQHSCSPETAALSFSKADLNVALGVLAWKSLKMMTWLWANYSIRLKFQVLIWAEWFHNDRVWWPDFFSPTSINLTWRGFPLRSYLLEGHRVTSTYNLGRLSRCQGFNQRRIFTPKAVEAWNQNEFRKPKRWQKFRSKKGGWKIPQPFESILFFEKKKWWFSSQSCLGIRGSSFFGGQKGPRIWGLVSL